MILTSNLIERLPSSLSRLEKLQELDLEKNRLTSDSFEGIAFARTLKLVNLSENKLTVVPS